VRKAAYHAAFSLQLFLNYQKFAIVRAVQSMSGTELYLRLLRHVRPYWRTFGIGVLGIIVVAATEPALPALLKPLLDGVFVNKDPSVIRWTPVFIVGLFVLRGLAEYVAQFALSWVGNRLVMDLRGIMFRKLLTLPARYYDDQASGNLISRLTFDVMQVTTAATSVLTACSAGCSGSTGN
jgi:subfamily B ATP-binding cassette protein MsbA